MQFDKTYVDPKAGLSQKEFYSVVRGNLTTLDKKDAWAAYEKEAKKQKKDAKEQPKD